MPDDTWFVPAVHVTTTDEVQFFDTASLPTDHARDFATVKEWLARAGAGTRLERSRRLSTVAADVVPAAEILGAGGPAAISDRDARIVDIFRRSRDWSEVRPEWGLAGNAAFIVALGGGRSASIWEDAHSFTTTSMPRIRISRCSNSS